MTQSAELPVPGSLVGGYTVVRLLGEGGMGSVFEAERGGARFALKVVTTPPGDAALEARFAREVKLASTLQSAHVVPVLEADLDPASPFRYLVMPLVRGHDLSAWLHHLGPFDPVVAVRLIVQAASGLMAAHAAGVVHRDMKPGNIMLAVEGSAVCAKVCDFGIAKDGPDSLGLTATSMVMGSPLYMAPEQMQSSKKVDAQADVWSLGMTLYELLAGRPALGHLASMAELMTTVMAGDIPLLQDIAPWVDPDLATIVQATLLRDRASRCPDLEALVRALTPFSEGSLEVTEAMLVPLTDTRKARPVARAPRPTSWAAAVVPLLARAGAANDPLLGRTIGERFRLVRKLGQGGMGAVYEAETAEGERVAVKVVLQVSGVESGKEVMRRFVREAKAVIGIQNPHVVRVIAADTDAAQEVPYLAMELLHGVDLDTLVKQVGPLEPRAMARVMAQACEGIEAAHARGVVHRDIKPANLFLHELPSGEIVTKVCDFGIAKETAVSETQATTMDLTRTGGMLGSPLYMSPEQAKNAKHVDARTDIWSLSVSLYEALAGAKLWQNCSTMGELILAICTSEVPNLQDVAPWVGADLAAVVHRGLARDPAKRWGSMREFGAALAALSTGATVTRRDLCALTVEQKGRVETRWSPAQSGSTTSAPLSQSSHGTGGRRQKRAAPWIFAGVGALVLAGGGVVASGRRSSSGGEKGLVSEAPGASAPSSTSRRAGKVQVRPAEARVAVGGAPRALDAAGWLLLEGEAGEAFDVSVEANEVQKSFRVLLSRDGVVEPSLLELPAPAAAVASSAAMAPPAPAPPRVPGKLPVAAGKPDALPIKAALPPPAPEPPPPPAPTVARPKPKDDL